MRYGELGPLGAVVAREYVVLRLESLGDVIVPDLASRIRDVVLVRRIFSSGKPWGGREFRNGEGIGEGMEMGRSVYEKPGTRMDGILSRQGGLPSK
jgi:hypothetical protein